MRLTVLGVHSPFPPTAGGACPGYLIEQDGVSILLDCGSGVIQRLRQMAPVPRLAAVVLSHLHGDHMSDVLVLKYLADAYGGAYGWPQPLPVHAPATPAGEFSALSFRQATLAQAIDPARVLEIGPFRLRFRRTVHPVETYAVRIEAAGRALTYSADTAYDDGVVALATGSDVLLCEATFLSAQAPHPNLVHMTAEDAARAAAAAGVGRLILTHFLEENPRSEIEREAAGRFTPVTLAREGQVYDI